MNKLVFSLVSTVPEHLAMQLQIATSMYVSGSNEEHEFLAGLIELVILLFFNSPCRYDPLIVHCYTLNHVWSGNYLGGALMYAVDAQSKLPSPNSLGLTGTTVAKGCLISTFLHAKNWNCFFSSKSGHHHRSTTSLSSVRNSAPLWFRFLILCWRYHYADLVDGPNPQLALQSRCPQAALPPLYLRVALLEAISFGQNPNRLVSNVSSRPFSVLLSSSCVHDDMLYTVVPLLYMLLTFKIRA